MRAFILLGLSILIAGCGATAAAPTPTPVPPTATPKPARTARPAPTATVTIAPAYRSFLLALCGDLRHGNASAVESDLMRYQYNSGLYWGMLGGGEGQTSDPSLLATWLNGSHVRCTAFTPGVAGHGTVLTAGWARPAPWSIVELDTISGHWKINDFTFGGKKGLAQAVHVNSPVLPYPPK